MAKCLLAIMTVKIDENGFIVGYSAAIDTPMNNFFGDYRANIGISIAANLAALRTKAVQDAAVHGAVISTSDVIVFGGPV